MWRSTVQGENKIQEMPMGRHCTEGRKGWYRATKSPSRRSRLLLNTKTGAREGRKYRGRPGWRAPSFSSWTGTRPGRLPPHADLLGWDAVRVARASRLAQASLRVGNPGAGNLARVGRGDVGHRRRLRERRCAVVSPFRVRGRDGVEEGHLGRRGGRRGALVANERVGR